MHEWWAAWAPSLAVWGWLIMMALRIAAAVLVGGLVLVNIPALIAVGFTVFVCGCAYVVHAATEGVRVLMPVAAWLVDHTRWRGLW